jgi:predicted membrane-bound mannosyltransferase
MSEKPTEGCGEAMVAIAIGVLFTPFTYALWGYTTSTLWSWFVVPQFALAPLSVPTAIGIALVLSQFRRRLPPEKDKTTAQVVGESIIAGIGNPLFALAIGAVVHRWFA